MVYWPGLSGGFLFDDYPNIVDNHGVQPHDASIASLVSAALSSPSSEFKRPLASLSFAANYLASGLDPYWMKLTNLVIHLLNGWLVFLLARMLLQVTASHSRAPHHPMAGVQPARNGVDCRPDRSRLDAAADQSDRRAICRTAHGEHGQSVRAARPDRLCRRTRSACIDLCPRRRHRGPWRSVRCQYHRACHRRHPGQGNCGDAAALCGSDRMGVVRLSTTPLPYDRYGKFRTASTCVSPHSSSLYLSCPWWSA